MHLGAARERGHEASCVPARVGSWPIGILIVRGAEVERSRCRSWRHDVSKSDGFKKGNEGPSRPPDQRGGDLDGKGIVSTLNRRHLVIRSFPQSAEAPHSQAPASRRGRSVLFTQPIANDLLAGERANRATPADIPVNRRSDAVANFYRNLWPRRRLGRKSLVGLGLGQGRNIFRRFAAGTEFVTALLQAANPRAHQVFQSTFWRDTVEVAAVCRRDASSVPAAASSTGHALEWHLVLLKSFEHITFDFVPWLHHSIVFLLPAFSLARFKAIGSIGDSMSGDGIEQLFVEMSVGAPSHGRLAWQSMAETLPVSGLRP